MGSEVVAKFLIGIFIPMVMLIWIIYNFVKFVEMKNHCENVDIFYYDACKVDARDILQYF